MTLLPLAERHMSERPDSVALIHKGRSLSYGQLQYEAGRMAQGSWPQAFDRDPWSQFICIDLRYCSRPSSEPGRAAPPTCLSIQLIPTTEIILWWRMPTSTLFLRKRIYFLPHREEAQSRAIGMGSYC
jgi:hypothetical protein